MTIKPKARYFNFVLYPESMPEDWLLLLEMLDIAIAISPLHDKDKNKDGSYKKPHYHIIYIAKNPVTIDAVRNKIKRALGNNSISYVQITDSVKNFYEYLTHESKDAIAKKKQIYDKKDIVLINGFDIDRYVTLDDAEKNEVLDLVVELIFRLKIENLYDFWQFYYNNKDTYGLPNKRVMNSIVRSNTGYLRLNFDGVYQHNKREIMIEEQKNNGD